jgi:hypothetical protein
MPVTGETDEIIIDLSDGKNIHITEFIRSYFELYFNIDIDVFQGDFLYSQQMHYLNGLMEKQLGLIELMFQHL